MVRENTILIYYKSLILGEGKEESERIGSSRNLRTSYTRSRSMHIRNFAMRDFSSDVVEPIEKFSLTINVHDSRTCRKCNSHLASLETISRRPYCILQMIYYLRRKRLTMMQEMIFFAATGRTSTPENYSKQFGGVLLGHVWRGRSHRQRDGIH